MKSAKIFVTGLYMHLLLSIIIPLVIIRHTMSKGWNLINAALLLFYFLFVGAVIVSGIFYIKYLRAQTENEKKPGFIHYFLQVIPTLDLISTAVILHKNK